MAEMIQGTHSRGAALRGAEGVTVCGWKRAGQTKCIWEPTTPLKCNLGCVGGGHSNHPPLPPAFVAQVPCCSEIEKEGEEGGRGAGGIVLCVHPRSCINAVCMVALRCVGRLEAALADGTAATQKSPVSGRCSHDSDTLLRLAIRICFPPCIWPYSFSHVEMTLKIHAIRLTCYRNATFLTHRFESFLNVAMVIGQHF